MKRFIEYNNECQDCVSYFDQICFSYYKVEKGCN